MTITATTAPSATTTDELDRILADAAATASRGSTEADRARWLEAIASALDEDAAGLIEIADEETHLGVPRLTGELARTTAQLRFFARVIREGSYLEATIDHADPSNTPPNADLRRVLVPIGPVGVFAASNFPFAFSVAGGDTASALAAGCPVVVKAHSGHLATSVRTADVVTAALEAAGAPSGLFARVSGRAAGSALVTHPATAAVGFTGSVSGGRALFDLAVSRPVPIPFYGELGSVNPVVVTAEAIAARGEALAEGLVGSFTLGAGQFCTKPGVVFVPAGTDFVDSVAAAVPTESRSVLLTAPIRAAYPEGLAALAAEPGVRVVTGEARQDADDEAASPVVFATDVATALRYPDVVLEECFGPVTVVVEYDGEEELLRGLAAVPGSLTGTLHSEPGEDVADILAGLRAKVGRLLFEGWPTGVAVTWSQQHGGPYPATTSLFTSVGATAVRRFLRPLAFQSAPAEILPPALLDGNPLGIVRRVDGVLGVH